MIGLGFSLGLMVGTALGVAAGGLVVWLWLERLREDAAADRELVETWESEPLRPLVGYPEPLSPRLHERPGTIVATARVRQAAMPGEGRHRAAEPPLEAPPPLRMWEPGEFTQEFDRIVDEHDKRITAGYYSSVAAHLVAAREVAR